MCLLDSDCGGDERCCFNGCQNDCVSPGMDKCKAKTSLQLSSPSPVLIPVLKYLILRGPLSLSSSFLVGGGWGGGT